MASLQIAQRQAGEVSVLDLWGQITLGETSEVLRHQIGQLIEANQVKVLLHLGGIHHVDSSGLGTLVAAYTSVQKKGGDLKLVQLSEKIQNLMVMTKLLTVFDIYEHEEQALKNFQ